MRLSELLYEGGNSTKIKRPVEKVYEEGGWRAYCIDDVDALDVLDYYGKWKRIKDWPNTLFYVVMYNKKRWLIEITPSLPLCWDENGTMVNFMWLRGQPKLENIIFGTLTKVERVCMRLDLDSSVWLWVLNHIDSNHSGKTKLTKEEIVHFIHQEYSVDEFVEYMRDPHHKNKNNEVIEWAKAQVGKKIYDISTVYYDTFPDVETWISVKV